MRLVYLMLAFTFFVLGYLHGGIVNGISIPYFHNLPNLLSVITCSALLSVFYKRHYTRNVIGVTLGLVMYEFMQLYLPERTFDWFDILASCLGMCLYLAVYHLWQYLASQYLHRSKTKNPA